MPNTSRKLHTQRMCPYFAARRSMTPHGKLQAELPLLVAGNKRQFKARKVTVDILSWLLTWDRGGKQAGQGLQQSISGGHGAKLVLLILAPVKNLLN